MLEGNMELLIEKEEQCPLCKGLNILKVIKRDKKKILCGNCGKKSIMESIGDL